MFNRVFPVCAIIWIYSFCTKKKQYKMNWEMVFAHSRQFKPIRGYLITKMGKNKMLKISETIDYTACAKNGAMVFFCVFCGWHFGKYEMLLRAPADLRSIALSF